MSHGKVTIFACLSWYVSWMGKNVIKFLYYKKEIGFGNTSER